jgi:hypothetical protein
MDPSAKDGGEKDGRNALSLDLRVTNVRGAVAVGAVALQMNRSTFGVTPVKVRERAADWTARDPQRGSRQSGLAEEDRPRRSCTHTRATAARHVQPLVRFAQGPIGVGETARCEVPLMLSPKMLAPDAPSLQVRGHPPARRSIVERCAGDQPQRKARASRRRVPAIASTQLDRRASSSSSQWHAMFCANEWGCAQVQIAMKNMATDAVIYFGVPLPLPLVFAAAERGRLSDRRFQELWRAVDDDAALRCALPPLPGADGGASDAAARLQHATRILEAHCVWRCSTENGNDNGNSNGRDAFSGRFSLRMANSSQVLRAARAVLLALHSRGTRRPAPPQSPELFHPVASSPRNCRSASSIVPSSPARSSSCSSGEESCASRRTRTIGRTRVRARSHRWCSMRSRRC